MVVSSESVADYPVGLFFILILQLIAGLGLLLLLYLEFLAGLHELVKGLGLLIGLLDE